MVDLVSDFEWTFSERCLEIDTHIESSKLNSRQSPTLVFSPPLVFSCLTGAIVALDLFPPFHRRFHSLQARIRLPDVRIEAPVIPFDEHPCFDHIELASSLRIRRLECECSSCALERRRR